MYTRRRANKEAPLPASLSEGFHAVCDILSSRFIRYLVLMLWVILYYLDEGEGEEADEQFWADQAEVAPNGTEGQADGNVDNGKFGTIISINEIRFLPSTLT